MFKKGRREYLDDVNVDENGIVTKIVDIYIYTGCLVKKVASDNSIIFYSFFFRRQPVYNIKIYTE